MKLKKTTAALLVAGLTIAGSSYAWANERVFNPEDEQQDSSADLTTTVETEPVVTIDPSKESEETSTESLNEEATDETTKEEASDDANEVKSEEKEVATKDSKVEENVFPEIPEGYTAGNLVALKQAYENAGSENAKQAILKNAQKAIAKFNAKNGTKEVEEKSDVTVDVELIGVKKSGQSIIEPVINDTKVTEQPTVAPSTTTTKVENQPSTKEQQKVDKKALQEKHKTEKKALNEKQKAEKKALKDQQKNEK